MAPREQVPLHILLEMVPVDYDRLWRLGPRGCAFLRLCSAWALRSLGRRRLGIRVRIADHKCQSLGIGRPLIALQPALQFRQLKCFAAASVQEPYLAALSL